MIIEYSANFFKSVNKIKNESLKKQISNLIDEVEKADKIEKIKNVKKLSGYKNAYRVRIGNYRIGFYLENKTTIYFVVIAHRKEIYRKFP